MVEAPERDDRDRPGEPGEAVGEEDAAGERQPGQRRSAQPCRSSHGPAGTSASGSRQAERDGEHEERLGGLLEGALGEVGGGQVGDGDQGRRRAGAAPGRSPGSAASAVSAGEDADREDLADEGLPEADPRHRRDRDGEAVRAERVAGVRRRPEAAAQPLGPGEVQAEVVVEADPEQAPAPADRERDREDDARRRSRPAAPARSALARAVGSPRPSLAAARERRRPRRRSGATSASGRRGRRGRAPRARTPVTVSTAPKPTAGSSHDQRAPPGEREQGAADEQRGGADQRRRGVGPDHQGGQTMAAAARASRARGAQYFSAARSSVSRRFSPRSGSAWPAPTTGGSSAASLRTDSFAFAWSQAQAGWGTLASPSRQRFQPRRVDQVDDVADQRHPVALAPEPDQPRRVAGEVDDAGSRPPRRPRRRCRRSSPRRRPSAAAGTGRSSAPAPPAAARGPCRGRSTASLSASATSSGWQ